MYLSVDVKILTLWHWLQLFFTLFYKIENASPQVNRSLGYKSCYSNIARREVFEVQKRLRPNLDSLVSRDKNWIHAADVVLNPHFVLGVNVLWRISAIYTLKLNDWCIVGFHHLFLKPRPSPSLPSKLQDVLGRVILLQMQIQKFLKVSSPCKFSTNKIHTEKKIRIDLFCNSTKNFMTLT